MAYTPTDFLPDDVDSLLQLLEQDEQRWADLAALHGGFGKYNDLRKIVLAQRMLALRSGAPPVGAGKWTDTLLEAAGHADAEYVAWVRREAERAQEFHALDQKRDRLYAKVKSLSYSPVR